MKPEVLRNHEIFKRYIERLDYEALDYYNAKQFTSLVKKRFSDDVDFELVFGVIKDALIEKMLDDIGSHTCNYDQFLCKVVDYISSPTIYIKDIFSDTRVSVMAFYAELLARPTNKSPFDIKQEIKKLLKEKEEQEQLDEFEKMLFNESDEPVEDNTSDVDYSNLIEIDSMNGQDFELFLGKLFEKMGYSVMVTKGSGDQGADLVIDDNQNKIVVQAKRYGGTVGNKAIQEVYSAKGFYKAHKAIVLTNTWFSRSAQETCT